MRSPLALAWRRQRATALAWAAGFLVLGALLGTAMASVGPQLDTPAFRAVAATLGGGGPVEVFFRTVVYVLAQIATASVVAATLRIRGEEAGGLADILLAGPVSRIRWVGAHLVVAVASVALALVALGLGAGLGFGTPGPTLLMTLAYLPACLVFAGIAAAALGWLPRLAAAITWTLLAIAIAIDFLGEFHLAGPAVLTLSPFVDTQAALVTGVSLVPVLAVLVLLAAALTGIGVVGLRRRDLSAG